MVGPSGLEPPTSCLSGTRSNLLSYEPMQLLSDRLTRPILAARPSGLVEMMGFGLAPRRCSVFRGSNSPPDCYSLPLPFESIFRCFRVISNSGGDDGIRTHDPLLAGQVLSQLSYTPIRMVSSYLRFLFRKFLCLPFFSKKVSGRTKWTRTTDLVLIRHAL